MEWATVTFSGLAVLVGAANFLYTQRAVGQREIAKWRREELQKLTAQMLQLSLSRQSQLLDYYESFMDSRRGTTNRGFSSNGNVWEMELLVEQFRLLDGRMAVSAEALFQAHYATHRRAAEAEPADPMTEIEAEMVDEDELQRLHRELVGQFQALTGLKESPTRARSWRRLQPV